MQVLEAVPGVQVLDGRRRDEWRKGCGHSSSESGLLSGEGKTQRGRRLSGDQGEGKIKRRRESQLDDAPASAEVPSPKRKKLKKSCDGEQEIVSAEKDRSEVRRKTKAFREDVEVDDTDQRSKVKQSRSTKKVASWPGFPASLGSHEPTKYGKPGNELATEKAHSQLHGDPESTTIASKSAACPSKMQQEETLEQQRGHKKLTRKVSKGKGGKRGQSGVVGVEDLRRGKRGRRLKDPPLGDVLQCSDVGSGSTSSWR